MDDDFPSGKTDAIETKAVLRAANELSFDELKAAGISRTAAANIIKHRAGPDGADGSADDNPFDTLAELDGVAYVGPVTLRKLVEEAIRRGFDAETAKANCIDGTRRFSVLEEAGRLEGRFVDFDGGVETFECVAWTAGTIKFRCYGDATQPPFYQIDLMRNASNNPQVEFNLVSVTNEPGGGDVLFSLYCDSVHGF